jgi:uncharacterized protein (DUF1800 family)
MTADSLDRPPRVPTVEAVMTERDAVRRLLNRVGLGPRPGEVDASAADGFEATLSRLTSEDGLDAGALSTPAPDFGPPQRRSGKAAANEDRKAQRKAQAQQSVQLGGWWLDRMAAVDHTYPERMTWFWHGHFATSVRKVKSPQLMHTQNETMRGLGRGTSARWPRR